MTASVRPPVETEPLPGAGAVYGLATLIEGWRIIATAATLAAILAVIAATAIHQRYEASVTVSAVGTQRSIPGGGAAGLAAEMLNLTGNTGMQATPALIARIAHLQSVLLGVASSRAPDDSVSIIERLIGRPGTRPPNAVILRRMGRVITPSWDRESGLVTIRVVHSDSALARAIADRTVDGIKRAFREASRAQATELREAQEARLDSASRQLRHAEEQLIQFLASNRVITPYSTAQAQFQSLQRAVDVAQSVYLQVRTEREAAVGKELEETPAMVVLDSVPAVLPHVAVSLARVMVFAVLAGLVIGGGIVLIRERSYERLTWDPSARDRLLRALTSLPLGSGRLAQRLMDRPPKTS